MNLESHPACGFEVSMIVSHKFNSGVPCVTLHQAQKFQLQCCCGTQLFAFFQCHEIGSNVCDPKHTQTPPDVDFESIKFLSNLFVVGCVMNVTYETCDSQVACSVPLCD